ncbi:MAG: hypothetical protein KDA22_06955 [Phycisphaerales bacterium]|nr:hypothetical protein [Phycisphaerales bacterium]
MPSKRTSGIALALVFACLLVACGRSEPAPARPSLPIGAFASSKGGARGLEISVDGAGDEERRCVLRFHQDAVEVLVALDADQLHRLADAIDGLPIGAEAPLDTGEGALRTLTAVDVPASSRADAALVTVSLRPGTGDTLVLDLRASSAGHAAPREVVLELDPLVVPELRTMLAQARRELGTGAK